MRVARFGSMPNRAPAIWQRDCPWGIPLELRQLKYFLAVVDSGSLSRAALEVFVAQSALSKQVGELEQELGVQLLHRSRTGVTMTEAGKIFYLYAQAILKQLGDVKAAVRSSAQHIVGAVVLAFPQSVSAELTLPLPLIRAAREQLPGVSLHLNEELTGNMLDRLRQGHIDLAIFCPVEGEPDMVFQPFVEEEFYLLRGVDPIDGLPDEGDVDLAAVARHAVIMPAQIHNHCTRGPFASALERAGLLLKVATEINSVHILKAAVEASMAPTVMPHALATNEIAQGRMRAHRIRPERASRTLAVCHCSHIPLTNAKKAVCELVFEAARQLCADGQWTGATYIGP
jgi:LysR family nitrogen assimilation transcriptional regulator